MTSSSGDRVSADAATAFTAAVLRAVEECKRLGYNPAYFTQMLAEHGAVETARRLINAPQATEGFARLWELRRLDLTVEAFACRPEFGALFNEQERNRSADRLSGYGYTTS